MNKEPVYISHIDNFVLKSACGNLLASFPDEDLQACFALKGYIFEPIENWLDIYEKGED